MSESKSPAYLPCTLDLDVLDTGPGGPSAMRHNEIALAQGKVPERYAGLFLRTTKGQGYAFTEPCPERLGPRRREGVSLPVWITLSFFLCPLAWSQERPGSTAAPILQVPVDARSVGMGTAFTAVGGDLNSLHYNPAGLALMKVREAGLMYMRGFEDQNVENVAFGSPLPLHGISGSGYSTAATSLLFSQNGSINVNQTNPDGSFLGSQTISAGEDFVATLSYAERAAQTPLDTDWGGVRLDHFMGFSGKVIHSTLAQQYSATAVATDLGYLLRCPELKWNVGASLLNLGSKMAFISEADPLPLTFRAGAAHQILKPSSYALTFAADGDYLFYERQWRINSGLEYSPNQWAAARIGYQFHREVAGLTIGFGVHWNEFVVDYAWAMSDALSDTHRFSFTYYFGRPTPANRRTSRQSLNESRPPSRQEPDQSETQPRKSRPSEPAPPVHQNGPGAPEWIY